MAVKRVYVEKKPGFRVEAGGLLQDLRDNLGCQLLAEVRILHSIRCRPISEEVYDGPGQNLVGGSCRYGVGRRG